MVPVAVKIVAGDGDSAVAVTLVSRSAPAHDGGRPEGGG